MKKHWTVSTACFTPVIFQYNNWSDELLINSVVPSCVVDCRGSNWYMSAHLQATAELYDNIIHVLNTSDELSLRQMCNLHTMLLYTFGV